MALSEQEVRRREELENLRSLGVDPYPAHTYPVNARTDDILRNYENNKTDYKDIAIAGRIMSRRIMGKASFAELQDVAGKIQIYVNRDDICPGDDKDLYNKVFKKYLDIGDVIGVKGYVFTTNVGEITIHVTEFEVLSKSLRPLPIVKETTDDEGNVQRHDAFSNPEARYRQRYLDLIVNPEVRETFYQRTRLINSIRNYLNDRDFLEVETPVLQPIYGGAQARPFKTYHNTLEMPLFLRIANELYLKRLIVGGFERVYEFAKDFRNEGMSRYHNPEFTQIELYAAYKDYYWMADKVEEMIEKVAYDLHGTTKVQVGEHEINFQRPWKRYTMYGIIQEYTGYDLSGMDEEQVRNTARELQVPIDDTMGRGKLMDEIFGEQCEPYLQQPTFIMDYPKEMSPLAKNHREHEGLVERFEVICNGKEICNAFSELNDPIDQRKRFEEQLKLREGGDEEAMVMDEDFLRALEYGMPPTAGLGIGIDRLTMIMTNQDSIQEVILFPQMRPEQKEQEASEEDFINLGVPQELVPVIQELGYNSIEELKGANPNKLFNDLCGIRKKKKLDIKVPDIEEVKAWMN